MRGELFFKLTFDGGTYPHELNPSVLRGAVRAHPGQRDRESVVGTGPEGDPRRDGCEGTLELPERVLAVAFASAQTFAEVAASLKAGAAVVTDEGSAVDSVRTWPGRARRRFRIQTGKVGASSRRGRGHASAGTDGDGRRRTSPGSSRGRAAPEGDEVAGLALARAPRDWPGAQVHRRPDFGPSFLARSLCYEGGPDGLGLGGRLARVRSRAPAERDSVWSFESLGGCDIRARGPQGADDRAQVPRRPRASRGIRCRRILQG